MLTLVLSVSIAICVSFLCSLMEAALFAVGAPFVRNLVETKSRVGLILHRFKENLDRPISAILILNTLANTAGAAVAGAAAADIWGDRAIFYFSLLFTLLILFVSEIIPKVLGATYNKPVSVLMAYPLTVAIIILSPVIFVTRLVSRWLRRTRTEPQASEEEVRAMAAISADEGSILPFEKDLIGNVLKLDEITAADIMTPRPVVFRKAAGTVLREVATDTLAWTFSRIPIHKDSEVDELTGFVLRRDVFSGIAEERLDVSLADIAHDIRFVTEVTPGHMLLNEFITVKQHLFAVVDEYGDFTGIVTLEDVLEFLVGREIVDEFDPAEDMQEEAKKRHKETRTGMKVKKKEEGGAEGVADHP
ncbi:MAG: CNNM domain-containing protein [Planctomycetota bacterium]|jgi:CBS domain containing-hemolysin-like protein